MNVSSRITRCALSLWTVLIGACTSSFTDIAEDMGARDAALPDSGVTECAYADNLAALSPPDADGVIRYRGTTVGASQHTSSICSDLESTPEGNDVAFAFTPSASGTLNVDVIAVAGSLRPVYYVRTRCNDPATELGCGGPQNAGPLHLLSSVERGATYYIVVSSSSSLVDGEFDLVVSVTP